MEATTWKRQLGSDNLEATTWKQQINMEATSWKRHRGSDNTEATSWKQQLGSDNVEATKWKRTTWKLTRTSNKAVANTWQRQRGRGNLEATSWKRQLGSANFEATTWKWQHGSDNLEGPTWKRQRGSDIVEATTGKRHRGSDKMEADDMEANTYKQQRGSEHVTATTWKGQHGSDNLEATTWRQQLGSDNVWPLSAAVPFVPWKSLKISLEVLPSPLGSLCPWKSLKISLNVLLREGTLILDKDCFKSRPLNFLLDKQSVQKEFPLINGKFCRFFPIKSFCIFKVFLRLHHFLKGRIFLHCMHPLEVFQEHSPELFSSALSAFMRANSEESSFCSYSFTKSWNRLLCSSKASSWMRSQGSICSNFSWEESISSLDWESWDDCLLSYELSPSLSSLSDTMVKNECFCSHLFFKKCTTFRTKWNVAGTRFKEFDI